MKHQTWPYSDVTIDTISIYDGPEVFVREFRRASAKERLAFAAYWLQAEILNGGVAQFFSNDTGVLGPEAALACRTIGLPKLADRLEQAMKWFGDPYPREREPRLKALADAGDDPFAGIEDEIVNLLYEENSGIEDAARKYLELPTG